MNKQRIKAQIKAHIYEEMLDGKSLLEARLNVQGAIMDKLEEASKELMKELCQHDFEHDYSSNGNAGGFSNWVTTCTNCGKQLTEVEVDNARLGSE